MSRRGLNLTKPPTIVDVAQLAGVSKSSVSNVIRNASCVTPEMRARVAEAVAALGYRPNVLARQLVQQRTTILGAVVGDLANPFHAEMAKQVERYAGDQGYRVMFVNIQTDKAEPAGLESLLEYRVAGVVFLAHAGMPDRTRQLIAGRIPAVFVTCSADWGDIVCGDDLQGAKDATRHLVELGHKRIAYFADPIVEDDADKARRTGYRAVMAEAGLQSMVFHWRRSPPGLVRGSREVTATDVLLGPKRVTAIFSSNDLGAIELLDCADKLGIRVPQDLSIVGFDDIVLAKLARINLTTVAQPQERLAELAIDTLTRRIAGDLRAGSLHRTVKVELVLRGSTAPPPRS
jgi:LacI family transcriptional regulator